MTFCVYDNPATYYRECWQDSHLVAAYSAGLFFRKLSPWETQPIPREHYFFGANIGDWRTGQLVGDAAAGDRHCLGQGQSALNSGLRHG